MARRWLGIGGILAATLALSGCFTTGLHRRPARVEEVTLPPADDLRFSTPTQFPKETLNQAPARKDPNDGPGASPMKGPSSMRGGLSPN